MIVILSSSILVNSSVVKVIMLRFANYLLFFLIYARIIQIATKECNDAINFKA